MKLRALNANTERFGYAQTLEYNNPRFNGHQLGVALCVINNETKTIEENHLSETLGDKETRDFLLGELLHEKKAILMEEMIMQLDENNNLVPKTIYYLPYFVEEHSRFKPTVLNDNIGGACNVRYDVQVELIFVTEELCRYFTVPFKTRNIPVMGLVNDLFEDEEALRDLGIKWENHTEDDEPGYVLDFYNEAGRRFNLSFSSLEKLKDTLVSVRAISIQCHIDGEDEDGNESE